MSALKCMCVYAVMGRRGVFIRKAMYPASHDFGAIGRPLIQRVVIRLLRGSPRDLRLVLLGWGV